MSCDREGNRRSGVTLAMRHRLQWFTQLRVQGLSKGDEHPANTLHTCHIPGNGLTARRGVKPMLQLF